jgi:hypothetical protein
MRQAGNQRSGSRSVARRLIEHLPAKVTLGTEGVLGNDPNGNFSTSFGAPMRLPKIPTFQPS